jgi:hypothetical protein
MIQHPRRFSGVVSFLKVVVMRTWWSSIVVLSLVGSVWVATAAADNGSATTKPVAPAPPAAAPSSHKESPGKDWIQISNKSGGFDFYVLKKWGTGPETFTLPAPVIKAPATPSTPNAPQQSLNLKQSTFSVNVQVGKGTTLKAATDTARNAAFSTPDDPGNKIDTDAATTLDGKPAWLLETEEKYVAGTVTVPNGDKPAKTHDIKHALKTYQIISVANGNLYTVTFVSDGGQYRSGLDNVKKSLDTFAWTDAAK